MRTSTRRIWLAATAIIAAAFVLFHSPVQQSEGYHSFADQRTLLGIPNFWNVISNLPFAIVGILGLRTSRNIASRIMFAEILLVSLGSGYYHWNPNSSTLVWDRLPMTIVFMSLLSIVISRWVSPNLGKNLLVPLLLLGFGSILWWTSTGDLRIYGVVQFGPMLILIPAILTDRNVRGLWPVVLWYALAKVFESTDSAVYSVFFLSGHTLKHFAAALATFSILKWSEELKPQEATANNR